MSRRKTMRELPKSRRPREQMVERGVETLDAAELLAVLLGSGTKGANVVTMSRTLLRKVPLEKLADVELEELIEVDGVGAVKAGKILAAVELGRRVFERYERQVILSPEAVLSQVEDIRTKQREYLVGLYLNARHELLVRETLAVGGLNASVMEPRDVYGRALMLPCAALVLVHNHPSGDPNPSEDDRNFTRVLKEAGELLGIQLEDHVVVAGKEYVSFREEGWL